MNIDLHSKIVQGLARRRFLQRSAVAMGGAALGLPALVAAKECKVTEQEILGPMYNYGAPKFQVKLAPNGEPGQKLMLRGTVLPAKIDAIAGHPHRDLAGGR